MPSCSVLIPAYNEAPTVAQVVYTARQAFDQVLVVDDGSYDATAAEAQQAGAEVLRLSQNCGKGGAVAAGAQLLTSDVVVLLDADLTGLTVDHIQQLAAPVLRGEADMSRGMFTGGRWSTATAQQLAPQLNGQRAMLRCRLLNIEGLAESRYGIEIVLTEHAKRHAWRTVDVPMPGVSQITKEEKRGMLGGLFIRSKMYGDIARSWLRNLINRNRGLP